MADTTSNRITGLIVSLVPLLDCLTTEGSIQDTSVVSSQGASWSLFIEDITLVFIRVFITGAFAMGSVIGSLITAFITQAFTLGLINHSAS